MVRPGTQHVCIVMATCNGAAHLGDQLQSFLDQDHDDWSLWIGDDGSVDGTREILTEFAKANPDRKVVVAAGPGQGSCANFLTQVVKAARPDACLAFSDQDDVWMPHKLSRALSQIALHAAPDNIAIYAARTRLTDSTLTPQGLSARHNRPPGFQNALVQNILGGNTIVLSPKAATLLARSVPSALDAGVPFHDWWAYLLVSGAGGQVIVDDAPVLFYRQHEENMLGHGGGTRGRLARARMLMDGTFSAWMDRNLAALERCAPEFTPHSRLLIQALSDIRRAPRALDRLRKFKASGLYRQTATEDRIMQLLAWTNRL